MKDSTKKDNPPSKTAILVAYRTPGFIEENIKKLKKKGFEIIVTADEPDENLLSIIKKYNIKSTISKRRRGKWRSLNDAVKLAKGEYILFIDSDTRIINLDHLEKYEVVEVRKEIEGSSILEKLVNIDYFNMLLSILLASKLNSCSLNGAAFGIRKDILLKVGGFKNFLIEDMELGIRLGINGYKVKVCGNAITKAPSNLSKWFAQRERWSVGGAEVVLSYFKEFLKKPSLWIPSLLLSYPAIIGFLINLILPDEILLKLFYFLLPFMLFLSSKLIIFVLLAIFEWHLFKNLIAILFSFLFWGIIVIFLSKKTKFQISYKVLPLYYFFYSPLWMMIGIVSLIKVILYRLRGKKLKVKGWMV